MDGAVMNLERCSKMKRTMKLFAILICGFAEVLSAQTIGWMSGTLKDTSGAPVPDAIVTAYLQAKSSNGKFPPAFNAKTGSDGSFTLNALAAGTYVLCAERADLALLNPCFWSAKATSATVPAGGSATGISLVAEKGIAVRIRVNDAQGLLTDNPLLDDIVMGVRSTTGLGLPARQASKDPPGKPTIVVEPPAKLID